MAFVHRLRLLLPVALVGAALLNARCGAMDSDAGFLDGPSGGAGSGEPRDVFDLDIGSTLGGSANGDRNLDPLCGAGACIPDDAEACDASLGGAGGEGSIGAAGGISYDPGDLDETGASCQVAPSADCEGNSCPIERACGASGASAHGEPCVVASDCAPGLACVGDGLSGICRPYCCGGSERSCDDDYFCGERQLTEHPRFYVPVCLPVDDCPLTDPYPCPDGQDCACQDGRACVVVRSDGSTACAQPGIGQTGDPCTGEEGDECAHGFVCSPSAGCMKLCSTVAEESGCPYGGTCQSPSGFPTDLGVCIGATTGSSAAK